MAIVIKTVNVGPMGRRFTAHCDVCQVKLPGNHVDREVAESVGSVHENDRHLARLTREPGE